MEDLRPAELAENDCSEKHEGSPSEGDGDHLSDSDDHSEIGECSLEWCISIH